MPAPLELTSIRRQYSLLPDMAFGWRPGDVHGAPIPMYFNYEQIDLPMNPETKNDMPIYFIGKRFTDSLGMHRNFANLKSMTGPDDIPSYHFKFPPKQNVIDALDYSNKRERKQNECFNEMQMFQGNNPLLTEATIDDAALKMRTLKIPLFSQMTSETYLNNQREQLHAVADTDRSKYLLFDSSFESANLDLAV